MNSILLIDDEMVIRNALCRCLRSFGYRVRTAPTVEEAENATRHERFDVVLVEYNVRSKERSHPRAGNGLGLIRKLRSRRITSQVLVYTAMAGDRYRISSLEAGADGFLTRHSGIHELVSCLNFDVTKRGKATGSQVEKARS